MWLCNCPRLSCNFLRILTQILGQIAENNQSIITVWQHFIYKIPTNQSISQTVNIVIVLMNATKAEIEMFVSVMAETRHLAAKSDTLQDPHPARVKMRLSEMSGDKYSQNCTEYTILRIAHPGKPLSPPPTLSAHWYVLRKGLRNVFTRRRARDVRDLLSLGADSWCWFSSIKCATSSSILTTRNLRRLLASLAVDLVLLLRPLVSSSITLALSTWKHDFDLRSPVLFSMSLLSRGWAEDRWRVMVFTLEISWWVETSWWEISAEIWNVKIMLALQKDSTFE